MKRLKLFLVASAFFTIASATQPLDIDPSRIDIYVTPFYNSNGPEVKIGRFGRGLASKDEKEFVGTIFKMKKSWNTLNVVEMYVAAIRLYDLGYRNESVYWFYSAQYRGRLFGGLLDRQKMGSMGSQGFELFHAHEAFFQLAGPFINGYASGDTERLIGILEKVKKEGLKIPDLKSIYKNIAFMPESPEWEKINKEINDGMGKLIASLKNQKESIRKQREARGLDKRYSNLKNKELIK